MWHDSSIVSIPLLAAAERGLQIRVGGGTAQQAGEQMRTGLTFFSIFCQRQRSGSPILPNAFSQVESFSSTGRGFSYLHITKDVCVGFSDREQTSSRRTPTPRELLSLRVPGSWFFFAGRLCVSSPRGRLSCSLPPSSSADVPTVSYIILVVCSVLAVICGGVALLSVVFCYRLGCAPISRPVFDD